MFVAHGPCEWVLLGNDYSCHRKLCMDLWHTGLYKVGEFLVVVYEDFLFYFHSVLPHDCFKFRQHLYHSESIQVRVDSKAILMLAHTCYEDKPAMGGHVE